jgi:hypothetical protein
MYVCVRMSGHSLHVHCLYMCFCVCVRISGHGLHVHSLFVPNSQKSVPLYIYYTKLTAWLTFENVGLSARECLEFV